MGLAMIISAKEARKLLKRIKRINKGRKPSKDDHEFMVVTQQSNGSKTGLQIIQGRVPADFRWGS
jgi:hypothetical protein